MALTMNDIASSKGIKIDIAGLEKELGIPIIAVNPRKNKGITELKKALQQLTVKPSAVSDKKFIDTKKLVVVARNNGGAQGTIDLKPGK